MWTTNEIKELIELYPDNFNYVIAKKLNKTISSINNMGYRLKLKKTNSLLKKRNQLSNDSRIKNGGRNLTYENLKNIAKKYKTRIDFIREDGPAYNVARIKGFLDDICSHMTIIKFSIPQLILREITDSILNVKGSYNNRKIIKPYEIDIYYDDFKLGFEFQGIVWHKNNKNDIIKSELAKTKNIEIIYINEIENSRNYERDIKNQLINKIKLINKLSGKNLKKSDIKNCVVKNIYLELYNKEEMMDIAKSYKSFIEFKTKEKSIYRKLLKLKLIDEATKHMIDKKINKIKLDDEFLKIIISKYDNLTDFRTENLNLYKHIKRVKKDFLLKDLARKKRFSINEIENLFKTYNSKTEFIKENPKMYRFIRRNKLTKIIFKG
jgi:hypothetical protein